MEEIGKYMKLIKKLNESDGYIAVSFKYAATEEKPNRIKVNYFQSEMPFEVEFELIKFIEIEHTKSLEEKLKEMGIDTNKYTSYNETSDYIR